MGDVLFSRDDTGQKVDAGIWDALLGKDDKPDAYATDLKTKKPPRRKRHGPADRP
ncbi:MAG TPA: hypothetical protein VFP01_11335 [Propionibacteriaceae bacterium]|nr:hypothetical protein [Propionibacteriaceae bacterium]